MSKNKSEIIIGVFEKAWYDAHRTDVAGRPPRGFSLRGKATKEEAVRDFLVELYDKLVADPSFLEDSIVINQLYDQGFTIDDIMQALRIEVIVETL